ncbi:MAG: hypothetical protein ABFD86_12975 [Bryobacteraceae bacterium]
MSIYKERPIEFNALRTVPLASRGGKVRVEAFGHAYCKGSGIGGWLDSLPNLLAANDFRALIDALVRARAAGKPILWGLGGHVIKCGLAPVLIGLMENGYATGFCMNGAAAIHDFEIALAGWTSEDVEAALPEGRFGVAEETGREMSLAIASAAANDLGAGEAFGRALGAPGAAPHADASLLAAAYRRRVPVTVHVAIGTDTLHIYPRLDASALGAATHRDFRLFCTLIESLDEGGVYLNVGSAVILPEVFLKAVTAVRNLGRPLKDFTTVNFDFLDHYRPRVNVVQRPHAGAGGRGIALRGHHELMLPLVAAALLEREG